MRYACPVPIDPPRDANERNEIVMMGIRTTLSIIFSLNIKTECDIREMNYLSATFTLIIFY